MEKKVQIENVYNSLREGYMSAAEFLLKNPPLKNASITSLFALPPALIQPESVRGAFLTLGKALPNVVKPEEICKLDEEAQVYQTDEALIIHTKNYIEEEERVDTGW